MCIIIAKPQGAKLPDDKYLMRAFESNSDGAGIAYINNGNVCIEKGFFNADKFIKRAKKIANKTNNGAMLLHCRIATQGGVCAGTCHPFPVSQDMRDLRKPFTSCDIALVHNGIISKYTRYSVNRYRDITTQRYAYGTADDNDTSDTMEFVTDFAAPLIGGAPQWYKAKNAAGLKKALEYVANSKLAILSNDGHIELLGNFIEEGGVYYSNATYKPIIYSYAAPTTWNYGKKNNWAKYKQPNGTYNFTGGNCPAMYNDYSYCGRCSEHKDCHLDF